MAPTCSWQVWIAPLSFFGQVDAHCNKQDLHFPHQLFGGVSLLKVNLLTLNTNHCHARYPGTFLAVYGLKMPLASAETHR